MPRTKKSSRKSSRRRKSSKRTYKYGSSVRVKGHGAYKIGGGRLVRAASNKIKSLVKQAMPAVKKEARALVRKYAGPAGRAIGGSLAGKTGAAIGGMIGSKLGQTITGHGAYMITSNTLLRNGQVPEFRGRDNETRVRHRGFIGDVTSNQTFTINWAIPINPANPQFTWLSTLASQYEEYKIHGLIFYFNSTSGNSVGSTNLSLGKVIMATQYNAALPAYTSEPQMENSEFACSSVPYNNMIHGVECDRKQNVLAELYTRNNAVPTNADIRMFDMGTFYLATTSQQATDNKIGELWYSIDVSFYKEKLAPESGQGIASVHYTNTTGISTSAYFGTVADIVGPGIGETITQGNNLALTFTTNTITFPTNTPLGSYSLTYVVKGSSTALSAPTLTYTNATYINLLSGSASQATTNSGQTTTVFGGTWYFQVTGTAPTITFSSGALPSSATNMDLIVTQLNYTLTD